MLKLNTDELIMIDVALTSHIEAIDYTIETCEDNDIIEEAEREKKEYEELREKIYSYGNRY